MTDDSHESATLRAYHGLADLFSSGQYSAGARLRESSLSEALGVSRTPIREALQRMAAEGVVEMLPNRGAVFLGFSSSDLEAITAIRAILEPFAVQLAVPQLTSEMLDELDRLNTEIISAGNEGDFDRVGELNARFHSIFLEKSGNRLLAGSLTNILRPVMLWRTFHRYSGRAFERSTDHHREIIEAARSGNADWAAAVMRSHILASSSTVLELAAK